MLSTPEIVSSAGNFYLLAKDVRHRYIYCNENYARGMGLDSPSQINGKSDFELYNSSLARRYQRGDAQVLKGSTFLNQVEPHCQGNHATQILTSKNLLKNKLGIVIGVVVSFIDITGSGITFPQEPFAFDEDANCYRFQICEQPEHFSSQEFRVFKGIMLGLPNHEIAKRMGLSVRTVDAYVIRINDKLQCEHKNLIIETAIRYGLTCRLDPSLR